MLLLFGPRFVDAQRPPGVAQPGEEQLRPGPPVGDQPLEGVAFTVNSVERAERTGRDGVAHLAQLSPHAPADVAIAFGTINVIGGFLVTDRMLGMFKGKKPDPVAPGEEPEQLP